MEPELKTPESNLSTSRYGRARRLKSQGDYCADGIISSMFTPETHPAITRVTMEDDTPDESDYNSVLKIVSRPSLPEISPCSPNSKVIKTYSNRKKIQYPVETFSWTQSVDLDVKLEENEIKEIEKSKKQLNYTNESEVQIILNEINNEVSNVSSSGLPEYKQVLCDSTQEISFVNNLSSQIVEVQSPIIDSSTPVKKEIKRCFEPLTTCSEGDLIWSRVGKHPFWPSMITKDPDSGIFTRSKGKLTEVHVRFFGDCGRRSWVNLHTSISFRGQKAFLEMVETIAPGLRKKSKLASSLKIPQSNMLYLTWLEANSEAESLVGKEVQIRLAFFDNVIRSNKKPSIETLEAKYGTLKKKESKKAVTSTPKIEVKTESFSTRTRKEIQRFTIFEYKKPLPVSDKPGKIKTKEEESWIKPKKGSLFKGVGKDRVCVICEKPNQVFKCRGTCARYFHTNCAMDPIGNAIQSDDDDSFSDYNFSICGDRGGKVTRTIPKLSLQEQIDAKMAEVMKETIDKVNYDETEEVLKAQIDAKIAEVMNESDDEFDPKTPHVTGDSVFLKCLDCSQNRMPACLVCGSFDEPRIRCSYSQCGRAYHSECLKIWPQTQWISRSKTEIENLICPLHVCHTCVSDDPRNHKSRSDRLIKCTRCPTSYHASNYCIPAGSQILTNTQLLCPKHMNYKKKLRPSTKHVNASWCFICSVGGSLICCETCPTSFHAECLKIGHLPEGSYICEECETGRLPLYDEVVWVKLGKYRWWPAQILFPFDVPPKIFAAPHNAGEFVVRFFGSHDYYWINRGRVFSYQEGDTGHVAGKSSSVNELFLKALEEAAAMYKAVALSRENYQAEMNSDMKPPPYIKIKANRPFGSVKIIENDTSINPCECSPTTPEPCGPDSDCLNRLLLTECNPDVCPAGTRCFNQQFQKRIYPALTPHKTPERGWGLKTLDKLEKGQFVIEYVGEMINDEEYQRRLKRMHELKDDNYYFLIIEQDRMLDAGPKGNVARFMNHSCQPNCETQKWTVNGTTRIGLFALENIAANTELTFNYNLESVGKEKKVCRCGAKLCSGFIGVKVNKEKDEKKLSKKQKLSKKFLECSLCFVCGKKSSDGQCQKKKCGLTYHLACVKLKKWPKKPWWCPRHTCSMCFRKKYIKCCSKCSRSFCNIHEVDNLRQDKNGDAICKDHEIVPKVSKKGRPKKRKIKEVLSDSSKENSVIPKKKKTWNFKINLNNNVQIVQEEPIEATTQDAPIPVEVKEELLDELETNRQSSKRILRKRKLDQPPEQNKKVNHQDPADYDLALMERMLNQSKQLDSIEESDLPLKKRKLNESEVTIKRSSSQRVLRNINESYYNEKFLAYGQILQVSTPKTNESTTRNSLPVIAMTEPRRASLRTSARRKSPHNL